MKTIKRKLWSLWFWIATVYIEWKTAGKDNWMSQYANWKARVGIVYKNGAPKRCFKCGHDEFKEIVKDRINYDVCEYQSDCERCGTQNGYWAYGYWMWV